MSRARHRRRPRPVLWLAALVVCTGFLGVSAVGAHAATRRVSSGFGVTLPGVPRDLGPLHRLSSSLGVVPGTTMWYEQWSSAADFPSAEATAVAEAGSEPEITWEPWNPADGTDQPAYSLSSIASGSHDRYLKRWATEIRSWGRPLRLRFAQEMNGDWYPWCEGVNGNRAGSYVAAWRHIHAVFTAAGVRNVTWIWSPNVTYPGSTPLTGLWPGGADVDAVALDGYNWGTTSPGSRWQSFAQVFSSSLTSVARLTSRPVLIGEVASAEVGGDKAQWIKGMFATLSRWPQVRGFTWFDLDKETDWRIDSSAPALAAFRTGISQFGS